MFNVYFSCYLEKNVYTQRETHIRIMSVYIRPKGSNNIFYFYSDKNNPNEIKTISYNLSSNGSIIGEWEKNGTISQLIGAVKSVQDGKAEFIREEIFKRIPKLN